MKQFFSGLRKRATLARLIADFRFSIFNLRSPIAPALLVSRHSLISDRRSSIVFALLLTACAYFLLPDPSSLTADPWSLTAVKSAWAAKEDEILRELKDIRQIVTKQGEDIATLKEGQRQLEKRVDDLGNGLGKRIGETRSEMRWLLGLLILLGLIPVASRFFEKRTDRTEAESLKAEMHALKDRLSRVEASANPGAKT